MNTYYMQGTSWSCRKHTQHNTPEKSVLQKKRNTKSSEHAQDDLLKSVCSFNKYLVSIFYASGTVPDADSVENVQNLFSWHL